MPDFMTRLKFGDLAAYFLLDVSPTPAHLPNSRPTFGNIDTPATPLSMHALLTAFHFARPSTGGPFAPQEILSTDIDSLIESGLLRVLVVHCGARTTRRIPFIDIVYLLRRQQGAAN